MNENVINADRMNTAARTAIKKLYQKRGIVPSKHEKGFHCDYLDDCSSSCSKRENRFCTGTWPYIGAHYGDAQVAGRSIRVLFVAMERGGTFCPESEKAFADTQSNFRTSAEIKRNPHMGGTAQLMECLVGCKDSQIYSQFALTNAVKCVEFTGDQRSRSTKKMKSKCSEHLWKEIDCLKPHLLITQGKHPRQTVLELFGPKPGKKFPGQVGEAEVMLADHVVVGEAKVMLADRFVILTTPHPAYKPGWKTKKGLLPESLQDAVKCAISKVKKSNGDTRTR